MAERRRILTSPLHMAGGLAVDQLGSLVSIDATLRWWAVDGRPGEAVVAPFFGSLAMQHAVERELAKEGHDRETLGRAAFVERVRTFEEEWRTEAAELLAGVRVGLGHELAEASTEAADVVDAARVAFVRFFDAGLLELADRVVDTCPRCGTVVHAADAERGTVTAELLTIRLPWTDGGGEVDVRIRHPELIPGVVAVVVPPGDAAEGRRVVLPMSGQSVPVIADATSSEPALVAPAHDPRSHDIARREGFRPVEVLAADGTVVAPASLAGLPRFGARAEAIAVLEGEGTIVARGTIEDTVARCRGCGTVLVPRLGRHWFLHTAELERAAADAVRQGVLTFSPPTARQDFLNWVGHSAAWCISHQSWGGHGIPVATCTDCGEPAVGIDPPSACRKCMAELEPESAVFDGRFLGVVWSLVAAGWPDDTAAVEALARRTTLAVRPLGLFSWAVPMAAIGMRLTGVMPFSGVVVHDATELPGWPAEDVAALRLRLLAGDLDDDAAADLAARLERPARGDGISDEAEAELVAAYDDVRPGTAVPALAAALSAGIPATGHSRLGRITGPLIGAPDAASDAASDQGGLDGLE